MQITGPGITPFDIKISPGWKPETKLSVKWKRAANNNYFAVDRGSDSDIYNGTIRVYGTEDTDAPFQGVKNFVDQIEANRQNGSNVIILGNFNDDEHIFGENINYTSTTTATVIDYGKREQISLRGWAVSMKFRCLSPAFVGSPALPFFKYLNVGYEADNEVTIKKVDTYNNAFTYIDHNADRGLFVGDFVFTSTEMQGLRQYLRLDSGSGGKRADTITITGINGVDYPFGYRRDSGYPYTVNIIDFKDMGHWGQTHFNNTNYYHRAKITFAEYI